VDAVRKKKSIFPTSGRKGGSESPNKPKTKKGERGIIPNGEKKKKVNSEGWGDQTKGGILGSLKRRQNRSVEAKEKEPKAFWYFLWKREKGKGTGG